MGADTALFGQQRGGGDAGRNIRHLSEAGLAGAPATLELSVRHPSSAGLATKWVPKNSSLAVVELMPAQQRYHLHKLLKHARPILRWQMLQGAVKTGVPNR